MLADSSVQNVTLYSCFDDNEIYFESKIKFPKNEYANQYYFKDYFVSHQQLDFVFIPFKVNTYLN